MPITIGERFKRSWNAFIGRDPTDFTTDFGVSTSYRPDRMQFRYGNEKSIVSGIYNRIAVDVSQIPIEHVRLDENGRYKETIDDGLNQCLNVEANVDQTGKALIQDTVMSMFDEGVVAIVPTDTVSDPFKSSGFEIQELRTGRITQWYPYDVKVDVYNERTGRREEIVLPKSMVAIVENPHYAIMNQPNSTLQRLIRALNKLDILNEQNSSSKLNLIVQLPYIIKSKAREDQAKKRIKDLEEQLAGNRYGIAYTDGTEHVMQLNRSLDNNIYEQVKDLTEQLYNQLGLTNSVFDGTADEQTMINYYNRTIDPIMAAITDEMIRKFLTKTARTQRQSVRYYRDPFRLVPVSQLSDIADKFTRNAIISSNEMRAEMGYKPVDDPDADALRNKNLNMSAEDATKANGKKGLVPAEGDDGGDGPSLDQVLAEVNRPDLQKFMKEEK